MTLCLLLLRTEFLLLLWLIPMTGRLLVSIIIIIILGSSWPHPPAHCRGWLGWYLSPTTTEESGSRGWPGWYLGRGLKGAETIVGACSPLPDHKGVFLRGRSCLLIEATNGPMDHDLRGCKEVGLLCSG